MFRRKAVPASQGAASQGQVSQESLGSLNGHKGLKGLAGKLGIGRAQS
jgi:hypothetical protein